MLESKYKALHHANEYKIGITNVTDLPLKLLRK